MSWVPNDLVTDVDLESYERTILSSQFNVDNWQARRQKALEDWLFPLLESRGFSPDRFRTRYQADAVVGQTSSALTDKTAAAKASDGLALATILASGSDLLYVGSTQPFNGLSVRVLDAPSATAGTLTVKAWTDQWNRLKVNDGTLATAGVPFSRGGAITWTTPVTLVRRTVNQLGPFYWVSVGLSAAPAGCTIGALSVIRRSRLCAPATLRTLALIFREAPTSQDGPWDAKAAWYEQEADRAWTRVADAIGGEFDTDDDDAISSDEAGQTAEQVTGGGWTLERM